MLDWIKKCPRRLMVGFHVPDYDQVKEYPELQEKYGMPDILSAFDPKEWAREIKKAHIQAFWFYSKCHYGNAYYPSKIGHVHSALKGRDLFGEIAEACLSEGIVPLCVYEFADQRMPVDKPEWCHCDVPTWGDGEATDAVTGANYWGPCLNGPYGDFAIEQALEVIRQYPIKGYYVDFLGLFGFEQWHCPYCNEKFKKLFGFEFQGTDKLNPEQYTKYIRWRYEQNNQYAKKLRKAIKDINPQMTFVHNYHGNSHTVGMQRAEFASVNSDFMTGDLFQFRDGFLGCDIKMRQYSSATRKGFPAEALLDGIGAWSGDFSTVKAIDSYRAELWTARSLNIATCSSIIQNVTGELNYNLINLCKEIYSEQMAYEEWLKDMEPVFEIGLVHSHDSVELGLDQEKMNGHKYPYHLLERGGWAQILTGTHRLWTVVSDYQVTPECLKKYKLIILPAAKCLSAKQAEAIREYVNSGGRVVATGTTSLFNEDGAKLDNFALADVFGVDFENFGDKKNSFITFTESDLMPQEKYVSGDLYFNYDIIEVASRANARIAGKIKMKTSSRLVNARIPTNKPGLVFNRFGKGEVCYCPAMIGMQYCSIGQNNIKEAMKRILSKFIDGKSLIELQGPESVGVFAHTQGARNDLVVNLVNILPGMMRSGCGVNLSHIPDFQKNDQRLIRFEEIAKMPKIHDITLTLKTSRKVKNVYLAPNRNELPFEQNNSMTTVTLPELTVHSMVAFEFFQ